MATEEEWSFRSLVIDRFLSGYHFPDWHNAKMEERAEETGNVLYLDVKLPVPRRRKRLMNGLKSTQFRWWLAGRISEEIREELRLR